MGAIISSKTNRMSVKCCQKGPIPRPPLHFDLTYEFLQDEKESNADLMCMLLANMAKSRRITDLVTLQYETATNPPTSARALVQLIDCFAKGAGGNYNKTAEYDYLAYVFADLAMQLGVRVVFITPYKATGGESVMPLSQLIVFTEQHSTIRRRGVAGTIKNMCFDISSHGALLAPMDQGGVGLLPYILLPLMGNEDYSDEDTEGMLDECQLLPPDKQREPETDIICTHLESLLLLTTMRAGREKLRDVKVYPIIRELHQHVEDQDVGHGCDRIVQVLMRDEEGEAAPKVAEIAASNYDGQVEEEDEDERVIEVL